MEWIQKVEKDADNTSGGVTAPRFEEGDRCLKSTGKDT